MTCGPAATALVLGVGLVEMAVIYSVFGGYIMGKAREVVPTAEKVKQVIMTEMGLDSVRPEFTLEEIGVDSLDLVELAMAIEEEFEIDIEDESCMAWQTVKDIIDYVTGVVGA